MYHSLESNLCLTKIILDVIDAPAATSAKQASSLFFFAEEDSSEALSLSYLPVGKGMQNKKKKNYKN